MLKSISNSRKAILLILLVLVLDQGFKIWIKTHMMLGEEINVIGNWFVLHFTENNGMAFGIEFGASFGKILLGLFRLCAIILIGWYLIQLIKQGRRSGFILSVSLIFAGAIGNAIDGMFYGLIFNDSYGRIASLFSNEGGYSSFMHGKVVDMLYFPLIHTHFPPWIPFFGSKDFLFFGDIFNLADSSIFIGVVLIMVFQKRYFVHKKSEDVKM